MHAIEVQAYACSRYRQVHSNSLTGTSSSGSRMLSGVPHAPYRWSALTRHRRSGCSSHFLFCELLLLCLARASTPGDLDCLGERPAPLLHTTRLACEGDRAKAGRRRSNCPISRSVRVSVHIWQACSTPQASHFAAANFALITAAPASPSRLIYYFSFTAFLSSVSPAKSLQCSRHQSQPW